MIYIYMYYNILNIRYITILHRISFFDLFLNILRDFLPSGHMVTRVTVTIFRVKRWWFEGK